MGWEQRMDFLKCVTDMDIYQTCTGFVTPRKTALRSAISPSVVYTSHTIDSLEQGLQFYSAPTVVASVCLLFFPFWVSTCY